MKQILQMMLALAISTIVILALLFMFEQTKKVIQHDNVTSTDRGCEQVLR
jgi:uncharacterized membrane protein